MGWLIFVGFIVIAISIYATVRKNSANEITRLNAQNKPLRDHIHNEIETINRVIDIVSNYRSQNVQEEKLIKLFKSLNNSEKVESLSLSFFNFESTDFSSVRNSIVAKLPIEYSKDFPTDNIGLESYTKNLVDKKEELSKIYNDLLHNSFTQDELLELYKKYCPQKLKSVKKDNCKHGWKIVGVISIYTIIVAGLIALGVYYSSIPASVMAKAAYKESIENQFKDTSLPDIKITDITYVLDEHSLEYTYEWYKVTKITATSTKISNYYTEKDNKEKAYELQMVLWDVYLKATYHNSDYEHMNGWTIDIESGDTIEFIIYDDVGNSYSYSRTNGKNPKLKINEKEFR
jgi:hypothetical protein